MRWFYNVASWNLACFALALFMLGTTALTAKVTANSPPPPTTSIGGCGCNQTNDELDCPSFSCVGDPQCTEACAGYENCVCPL